MTEALGDNPKLRFVLREFKQIRGFRVFAFEGITSDWTRTPFTVKTDLALIRRYGIRLQELPLLCRAVLEESYFGETNHEFTYTEAAMSRYAADEAIREEAAHKRKAPRRPITEKVGVAWRVPPRAITPNLP